MAWQPQPEDVNTQHERIIQQEILLAKARELKKDNADMAARMDFLANSRERQLTFLLRKAQQEHRRQEKFLREAAALLHQIARYARE